MNSFKHVHAFQIELEFGSVGFWGEGKPEHPKKNLAEQRREPTTNSTHIWHRRRDSNLGHIGGRQVFSPLHHPCFLFLLMQNNHIWNPDQGHTYLPKRTSTMFTNVNISKFIFVGFACRILAKGTNFKTRLMTNVVVWSQELSWIVNIKLLYYCIFLNIICINKTVNRKHLCNIQCEKNPIIRYTLQVLHVL